MLVNQFTIIYAAHNGRRMENGASDPKEWTLKIKNANFPFNEYKIEHKSKYDGGYNDLKPS